MRMYNFFKNTAAITLVAVATGSLIIACGGSSSTVATTSEAYSGPGSRWDATLSSDNTFTITHQNTIADPVDMTVTGTYVRQSNGIVVLTVGQAVDGAGAPLSDPASGDTAWAIDVPGYALMLKPMGSGDQLIPMVTSGECPTSDLNANWVIVKADVTADATNTSRDWFGTFSYNATTGAANLPTRYALANPTSDIGGNSIGSGSCSNGVMTVGAGPDGVMYMATNGAIVHTGADTPADENDDNFIFGLTQKAITDVNNLDGTYAGMLFDDSNLTGEQIVPVTMSCTAGTCTATQLDSTDLTTALPGTATVDFTAGTADQPATGFITGTVSDGGPATNLACMADINVSGSGRVMTSCVGQSPGDATKLFNVLFVSN